MRLGIDFGTTRTALASEDRGNYPMVCFRDERGSWIEWYPSRIAARNGALAFGHKAEALRGEADAWHLPSIKRLLAWSAPDQTIEVPGLGPIPLLELLSMFLSSIADELRSGATNITVKKREPLEAMISVPANANSNQRFMTLEAFKAAGFSVIGMLNEPSAAGVEYSHRYVKRPDGPRQKQYLAVYDLGGGTFDAAAIQIAGMRHDVISSDGVERLGGDDLDEVLLEMIAAPFGGPDAVTVKQRAFLTDECRDRKESLTAHTKKLLVDTSIVGREPEEVVVTTEDYYDRCAPLVARTIDCLDRVLAKLPGSDDDGSELPASVATIYLVGGSTSFPLVSRALRDRYGRRVQRSQYPHGAVAIGLAVAANPDEPYYVRETLTRHFGVFREADSGSRVVFDPIFVKDAALETNGGHALYAERSYRPAHNIGHFRYAECASLSGDGDPDAGVAPWDAITFPFDPRLQPLEKLSDLQVERVDPAETDTIVEEYSCDPNGIVQVTLRSLESGFARTYRLAQSLK